MGTPILLLMMVGGTFSADRPSSSFQRHNRNYQIAADGAMPIIVPFNDEQIARQIIYRNVLRRLAAAFHCHCRGLSGGHLFLPL